MHLLVIVNPKAGTAANAAIEELFEQGCGSNATFEIFTPNSVTHLKEGLSGRLQQQPLDAVVIAGGDGTIMDALPSIVGARNISMGIIPLGTGNLLAKNLRIPMDIEESIQTIVKGHTKTIDLGQIGSHLFALNAGVGLDADIMDQTDRKAKKKWGHLAYVLTGASLLQRKLQARIRIEADGRTFNTKALGIMFSNAGSNIGGGLEVAPDVQADDGTLHGTIFKLNGFLEVLTGILQLLQGRRGREQDAIEHFKARKIVIDANPKLKAQADGNVIGETPITIEMIPQKLKIFVPE